MKNIYSALMAGLLAALLSSQVSAGAPRKIQNLTIDGSTQSAQYVDNAGVIGVPAGMVAAHETFINPPTCSTFAYVTAVIATSTMYTSGTTSTTFRQQPVYPSALVLSLFLDTGTYNTSVYAGQYSTVTVKGIDSRGYRRTEQLAVTTAPTVTNYAYMTISSITWSKLATTFAGSSETARVFLNVGSTDTYGLANDISTFTYAAQSAAMFVSTVTSIPAGYSLVDQLADTSGGSRYLPNQTLNSGVAGKAVSALSSFTGYSPVYKVIEGNSVHITSATISPAFSTFKPTTAPNGSVSYDIWYLVFRSRRPIY